MPLNETLTPDSFRAGRTPATKRLGQFRKSRLLRAPRTSLYAAVTT